MKAGVSFAGLRRHVVLTLRLNFRSKQALAYGYVMPVIFLLAFGSLFRSSTPVLFAEMGQLLTITILGGACLGLPTTLVAERERGLWRLYRLLPVPTAGLLAGALLTRVVLIGSAAFLQIVLARLIFHTPFPLHPGQTAVASGFVTFAFLGLGLLVTALADNVPAVQALGQCLFLPMIMIGGVGVPLVALPLWVQRVAGFMPGRYAVESLQHGISDPAGLAHSGFNLAALVVIGCAAGAVGIRLFRWDAGPRAERNPWPWVAPALLSWAVVGIAAMATGHLQPVLPPGAAYESVTDEQMNRISFDDLPGDNELVSRLAPRFSADARTPFVEEFSAKLRNWPSGQVDDSGQRVRNLLSVAAIADVSADLHEAEIGRIVFDDLQARQGHAMLRRVLTWIVLRPDDGAVITQAGELGLKRRIPEPVVRDRSVLYAKKYLGRLLGRIPD
jgi:ABC-type multidrug transport system permease subunit